MHLQRVVGDLVGHLRAAGLGERRVEGGEPRVGLELAAQRLDVGVGAGRRSVAGLLGRQQLRDAVLEHLFGVDDERGLVEQSPRRLDVHPHVGEQSLDGRELADGRAELDALGGVLGRRPVRRLGDALRLRRDGETGAVHEAHDVGGEAAPALADEQRRRVVELQLARRRAVDAELVLEAADAHVLVALVEEHAEPAGVGRAFFRARQDEADLAAAVGDEALDAVEEPGAVGLFRRLELDVLEVAAGLGLGERHAAGDLAAGEARQVGRLHLVVGELVHGLADVLEPEDVHERGVGAADHLDDHHADGDGEVEAAVLARQRDAHEVGLLEALEALGDAGGVADLALDELAAGAVDVLRAGLDVLAGEVADDLERARIGVDGVLEIAGRVGEVAGLRVVVLAQAHHAREVEAAQGLLEVPVVAVEVAHDAPPSAARVAGAAAPPAPFVLYAWISSGMTLCRSPTTP